MDNTFQQARDRLMQQLRGQGLTDERVLAALGEVPRHGFIDASLAGRAYDNTPLPIGYGQTISQPYIVGRMTEMIVGEMAVGQGRPGGKILEIGTGCGYQTAILARLADRVFSVERIGTLADTARERLRALGIGNARIKCGDGYEGWPEHAPYDGILVTAAPPAVPEALCRQLAEGGRMAIPVGARGGSQRLLLISRAGERFDERAAEYVVFVPMLSGVSDSTLSDSGQLS